MPIATSYLNQALDLTAEVSGLLAQAQTEEDFVAAQNHFNSGLNTIKAQAKANPVPKPKPAPVSEAIVPSDIED